MKNLFGLLTTYVRVVVLLSRQTSGDHFLPFFTGQWFTDIDYYGGDACGIEYCNPTSLSLSPEEALLNIAPFYSDCLWNAGSIEILYNSTGMPVCFVSENTDDWSQILLDPNAAVMSQYQIRCEDDGEVKHYYANYVWPFYDCPTGTRLSYDSDSREKGCTTTPLPCVADVVGRDLSPPEILEDFFPEGAEDLGHIGLVTSCAHNNPDIMEVLGGSRSGIYFNPLYGSGSFSEKSEFWGIKYGLWGNTRLTYAQAADIIFAGTEQTYYRFKYTITWFYYPGGTEEHYSNCKFRCDTFVYYCYDAGADLKIQDSFTMYTFPKTIFADFSCGPDAHHFCPTYLDQNYSGLYQIKNKEEVFYDIPLVKYEMTNSTSPAMSIFSMLRPMLINKAMQKEHLPRIIKQFQISEDNEARELFARCLCFELSRMELSDVDLAMRPMLADVLWQYRYILNDNFPLAIMNNNVRVFKTKPPCRWLNTYFAIITEKAIDKEKAMINYVDQQENLIEQANLVSASKLSSLSALTARKKCEYGKLFQHAYNHNNSYSSDEKILLTLGLWELKTHSVNENIPPYILCMS